MFTAGHQERVAELVAAIAARLDWPIERQRFISLAASVHDIGKMMVPAEYLSKSAALSKYEYQLVKGHAEAGATILRSIPFPWPVADVVAQHHERLDGSGYPLGLSGDEIGAEARVLAVADVVEAMLSFRPYRPAQGLPAALQEVRAGRGTRFDAEAVDACAALFEVDGFEFRESRDVTFVASPLGAAAPVPAHDGS